MFRAMFLPIIRSTWLYLQCLVVFTQVAAGWPAGSYLVEYYQILQIQSSAPDNGWTHRPKNVELTRINKLTGIVASCWFLSQKSNVYCAQNLSFRKSWRHELIWQDRVEPDRPQMTVRYTRTTCYIPKATNTHSEYINIYCIPTAAMVEGRLLINRFIRTFPVLLNIRLCRLATDSSIDSLST